MSNFMRWWQLVSCVILFNQMCLFSIKYVVQSGRKAVCPLWRWQSGIRPAAGTAIRLPAPTGQQSGGENCDPGKSHTGWHLSKQFKRNSREYPLCSQITRLPPPFAMENSTPFTSGVTNGLGRRLRQVGLEDLSGSACVT